MLSDDAIWERWKQNEASVLRFARAVEAETAKPLVKALKSTLALARELDYVDYGLRENILVIIRKALTAHRKEQRP